MRFTAVVLAAILSSAPANERAMERLESWIRAVDRHAVGEKDEALVEIARGPTTISNYCGVMSKP